MCPNILRLTVVVTFVVYARVFFAQMDVAIRKFLNSHILFREITNELFIDALVAAMKTRVFVDGAFIIRKGEIGRAMFFNLKGNVEVISDDGILL